MKNVRHTTAIVLRKIRGAATAVFLMPARFGMAGGPSSGFEQASPLTAARSFLAFVFPMLVILAIAALIATFGSADHISPFAGLGLAGTLVAKDNRAGEFRAEAQKLRDKLADPATNMTQDEVQKALDGIKTFEARAAAVAGFTPQDEIDRGGGDAEVRQLNPDADIATDDVKDMKGEMDAISKLVRKYFGGPATYLRMLGERTKNSGLFNTNQLKVYNRLQALHKRAIVGTAGDGSGAEYLLPLEQVNDVFSVQGMQPGVAQIARRYPVSGRTLRIPALIQDSVKANADGSGSSSVTRPMASIAAVDIIGEGDEKPERQPRFTQRLLTIYKLAAYTEMGDETVADDFTGKMVPVTIEAIGGAIMDRVNEYTTTDGTGTAMPLGALNAANGALLVVNRQTSQSITTTDIFSMFAAHTFGNGQSAWFINRTALPALFALTLGNNTLITFLPSLNGTPQMMLLGLPVYMGDLNAILGVQGDLALINGGFYAMAIRQALTVESSIHYKFRNDLTAYRFVTRFGGIPIPTDTYAYKAPGGVKQAEHSPFVVLGDDVTS